MLITEPQVPYNVEKTPAQSLLKEFLQAIVYGNKGFKIERSCQCQNTIRKPTERLNLPETLQRVIHAKLCQYTNYGHARFVRPNSRKKKQT